MLPTFFPIHHLDRHLADAGRKRCFVEKPFEISVLAQRILMRLQHVLGLFRLVVGRGEFHDFHGCTCTCAAARIRSSAALPITWQRASAGVAVVSSSYKIYSGKSGESSSSNSGLIYRQTARMPAKRRWLGVDEVASHVVHSVVCCFGLGAEAVIFFQLLALHTDFFKGHVDVNRFVVIAAGPSVCLDDRVNRIRSIRGVDGSGMVTASAATVPPAAMAPRIDLLERLTDVFAGGVLCTLSAWVIWRAPSWLGLEPGRKVQTSPRLASVLTQFHETSNRDNKETPGASAYRERDSGGGSSSAGRPERP